MDNMDAEFGTPIKKEKNVSFTHISPNLSGQLGTTKRPDCFTSPGIFAACSPAQANQPATCFTTQGDLLTYFLAKFRLSKLIACKSRKAKESSIRQEEERLLLTRRAMEQPYWSRKASVGCIYRLEYIDPQIFRSRSGDEGLNKPIQELIGLAKRKSRNNCSSLFIPPYPWVSILLPLFIIQFSTVDMYVLFLSRIHSD